MNFAAALASFREGTLMFVAGGAAGGLVSFHILRETWFNAQALGDASDKTVVELRKLHGKHDDVARVPRMEMPSLLDLRLRRDLSNAWNASVMRFYHEACRWI